MSCQLQKEEKVDLDQQINKTVKEKLEIDVNWSFYENPYLGETTLYGWLEFKNQKICGDIRLSWANKDLSLSPERMKEELKNQFLKIVGEIFHKKAESISFNFNNPLDNTLTILELQKEIRELKEDRDNWKKSSDYWQNKCKDVFYFFAKYN